MYEVISFKSCATLNVSLPMVQDPMNIYFLSPEYTKNWFTFCLLFSFQFHKTVSLHILQSTSKSDLAIQVVILYRHITITKKEKNTSWYYYLFRTWWEKACSSVHFVLTVLKKQTHPCRQVSSHLHKILNGESAHCSQLFYSTGGLYSTNLRSSL